MQTCLLEEFLKDLLTQIPFNQGILPTEHYPRLIGLQCVIVAFFWSYSLNVVRNKHIGFVCDDDVE